MRLRRPSACARWLSTVSDRLKSLSSGADELYAGAQAKADAWLGNAKEGLSQQMKAHAAWVPLQAPVEIGDLPLLSRQLTAFEFPSEIPATAREVLIYVKIFSGNNGPSLPADFLLYTQEGDRKYSQLLYWFRYPQDAVGFNSENLWFPLTGERKIYIRLDGTPSGKNSGGKIVVLGYRE